MSILQANGAGLGGAGDPGGALAGGGILGSHALDQSLRLQNGVTQNLTVSSAFPTATDRKKVTISFWYKRSLNSPNAEHAIRAGSNGLLIRFNTNGTTYLYDFGAGSGGWQVTSTTSDRLHRDPSAFYHYALILDSTQATASDRVKLYINGELWSLSTWSVGAGASRYPNLNASFNWHTGSTATLLTTGVSGLNGYVAEFLSIDGQNVSINDLGETVNGVWVPKEYTGSFGNAGFHLDFADSSDIGNDVSVNNVDFTADAGFAAHDVVPDSPTNNFPTYNPVYKNLNQNILSEANLQNDASSNYFGTGATMAVKSGKWYCEVYMKTITGSLNNIGIDDVGGTLQKEAGYGFAVTAGNHGIAVLTNLLKIQNNGSDTQTGLASWSSGDIVGMALDLDSPTKTLQFYKNNVAYGTAETISTSAPTGEFVFGSAGHNAHTHIINFGQDSTFAGNETAGGNTDGNGIGNFAYAPPSGFLALCSANLPEPTIGPNSATTSDEHFTSNLWTGTGSDQTITTTFAPDFVWVKCRSTVRNHRLVDTVRGATLTLSSDLTDVELTEANHVKSFSSTGFTVGGGNGVGASGETHVGWSWKAGGTAVSNTDGDITSQVSAAPDAGFSIVSYTGTGANATIGHGLSSAPEAIIIKARTRAENWLVYHKFDGGTDGRSFLNLNTTGAKFDNGPGSYFQDTPPTSSVFYQNSSSYNVNTDTYIAYCFHSVEGFSKVGSYVGNGSADGSVVYTGFRPAFVLLKKSSAAGDNWSMYDNKRDVDNVVREYLIPNQNAAAASTDTVDFLSNGFKVRNSGAYINTSGATYIYLAFAEAPFKYANAR